MPSSGSLTWQPATTFASSASWRPIGRRTGCADLWGLTCPLFAELEPAVEQTGANLVVNLTPPEAHRGVVGRALELGCDVFGEKPMTATLAEAYELIAIADREGRSYSVMQNRRYVTGSRALRDGLVEGRIGSLRFVSADYFMSPYFGGFRHEMPSPLLLDMAIHTFDQVRFLTGADATSVFCRELAAPGSRFAGDASAVCLFELSDGSVFSYRGSWDAPGCRTSWESSWRLVGANGTATWDGHGQPYAEVVAPESPSDRLHPLVDGDLVLPTWRGKEGHPGCIDAVLDALRDGRRAETDCRDNVQSLAMVFAALKSARENRVVELEEVHEEARAGVSAAS